MIDNKRILESKMQYIELAERSFDGFVLDVGGGGEGIIGMLYGAKTVAIDKLRNELSETSNVALKIVMDACDMSFLDASFHMAVLFYTLMYMDAQCKKATLKEVCRVLKPNGIIEIWDSEVPEHTGGIQDVFIANVTVNIKGQEIKTGYGVGMSESAQTMDMICSALTSCGLQVEKADKNGSSFHVLARKK